MKQSAVKNPMSSPPNTAASTVVFARGPGPGPVLSAKVMDAAVRTLSNVRPPTKVRPPIRPSSPTSSSDSNADTVPPGSLICVVAWLYGEEKE